MIRTIVLAAGCSWRAQTYFTAMTGVLQTRIGFVNGNLDRVHYRQVCQGTTGFAEACEVKYDDEQIATFEILRQFFQIIDPTSKNRQGYNLGPMYRTGIYYDYHDRQWIRPIIQMVFANEQTKYTRKIAVEVQELTRFVVREPTNCEEYLEAHQGRRCDISLK